MTCTTLRHEVRDRILTLTLDRPESLNPFAVAMSHELVHAFERTGGSGSAPTA